MLRPTEEAPAVGLAGSHQQFVRTWSACLGSVRTPSGATPLGYGADGYDDAYAIAARYLAAWRGRPRTAERFAGETADSAHSRGAFLLPPTPIAHASDVTASVEALLALRRSMPEQWSGGRASILYTLCTLVAEMGQNVCDHSRSVGCVAVRWHGSGPEDAAFVSLGIVDAGIGIRASIGERLRAAGQPADLSDAAAIARALELPYPDGGPHRGAGLRMSRDLIHRHQGVMHIRSGHAVVSIGSATQYLFGECAAPHAPVPGAQISIMLSVG